MSEVISFRLDKNNPREAMTLEVLNAWIEIGFSARSILTNALLELEHPASEMGKGNDDHELGQILEKIVEVLDIVNLMKTNQIPGQETDSLNLNERFRLAIKQGVKPGMKSS